MMKGKNSLPVDVYEEVLEAEARIRPYVLETPLEYSAYLSRLAGCDVFLKLENMQTTGSFKYRGAMNKILSLTPEEQEQGVVACSTGNHGAAVAYASRELGCPYRLFLPENVSEAKLEMIRLYGAEDITFYGTDVLETETKARSVALETGSIFVSPYNDAKVIGGQGTIGVELHRGPSAVDAVIMPVGGGGLASGIAGYLKNLERPVYALGAQPMNSPVMYESVKAGRLVEMESKPTLSEGTWGGIEPGSITFPLCCTYIDDYELITESELEAALLLSLEKLFILMEGAAALPIAALLKRKDAFKNKTVVLVISGRRLPFYTLKELACKR